MEDPDGVRYRSKGASLGQKSKNKARSAGARSARAGEYGAGQEPWRGCRRDADVVTASRPLNSSAILASDT